MKFTRISLFMENTLIFVIMKPFMENKATIIEPIVSLALDPLVNTSRFMIPLVKSPKCNFLVGGLT